METEKLYYADAFMREFTAVVLSCEEAKGAYKVVLDRTAFYPEGGGQPPTTGRWGTPPSRTSTKKTAWFSTPVTKPWKLGRR